MGYIIWYGSNTLVFICIRGIKVKLIKSKKKINKIFTMMLTKIFSYLNKNLNNSKIYQKLFLLLRCSYQNKTLQISG